MVSDSRVMNVEDKEKALFAECKESVGDVFGWKIIIFLPQNSFWKAFVMFSVAISFLVATTKAFYCKNSTIFSVTEIVCDSLYVMDVLCASLNFGLTKTRILRHGRKRPFIFLIIDFVSLLPLNLFYKQLIYTLSEKSSKISYILRANVILRIYQIPLGFSEIKKTVCRITPYYFLTFIELFVYYGLLGHFLGCFLFLNFDEKLAEKCLESFAYCVTENDFLTLALLDHNYIRPLTNLPLKKYTLLINIAFLVGFIFLYTFVIPKMIYIHITYLKQFFEYSNKQKQLKLLIENLIKDKDLKKKITQYFHYTWTYGRGCNLPEILNIFPTSFRKTIFCDIHWEAIKHSHFLQDVSPGCKRSLALYMRTEFVLPKTILFEKHGKKNYLIYLQSGSLQIMAEENSESPVLNFSEGTVLGESSLFFNLESKAVVRTGKFSVIQFLRCVDFCRVLSNYPKDFKKVFNKLQLRLKVARTVQKSKDEIIPLFAQRTSFMTSSSMLNIKWIKEQFRALVRLRKAEEMKALLPNPKTTANYELQLQSLQTQVEHTSMYLSLLCLDDGVENMYEAVCLQQKLPWLLDPRCNFLKVWNIIINMIALVVVVLYPGLLGWFPVLPGWFFSVSVVINFVYIVDVLIMLITAVEVKDVLILQLSAVIYQRFSNFLFYLDLVAALPLYLFIYVEKSLRDPFKLNMLIMNTLLKSYKLLPTINHLTYAPSTGIFYRTSFKYILINYFIIYSVAAVFNLIGVECIFYDCNRNDWYADRTLAKGEHYKTIVSLFVALFVVLNIPNKGVKLDNYTEFYIYFTVYVASKALYWAWKGESVACYVLENSKELAYRSLTQKVHSFLQKRNVSAVLTKRVMDTFDFQWNYDHGNYITQSRRILEELSSELRDEVDRDSLLPILQKSRLFKWETEEFLVDLCRKADRLALPADSLLVTFGAQSMTLYVVHKGHVQVNSFIVGDSHLNVSTPLVFGSGDTFPVLVAFSQIPAAVSAITITDCELLTLNMEDILSLMILHKVFPDVIEALRAIDLTPMTSAKLGLSRVKEIPQFDEVSYRAAFKRLKWLGTLLRFILIKKAINSSGAFYLLWETIRCIFIIFNLLFWPTVFSCCTKSEWRLQYIHALLVADVIPSLVDFYLRLYVGYYNKMGIYITHPLSTSAHYLTSSFVVDLIAFIPNCHMIYLLQKKQTDFTLNVVVTHVLMRSLSFYRIFGLLSYLHKNLKQLHYFVRVIKWIVLFFLALHFYLSLMVYLYFINKRKQTFVFSIDNQIVLTKPYELYFYELAIILSILLNSQNFFDAYTVYTLVSLTVVGTLAVLCQTFLISRLTLNITGKSQTFTTYQYYLRSFVEYLNHEKADEEISNEAIAYFRFKWEKHKGVNMHDIFSRFPIPLHEDIILPLVRDSISSAKCFSGANEAFYRILSRNVQMVALMKDSIIIFKNQVQDDIFFIHKGKCFVEEVSKTLLKGAIIGDIRYGEFMKHTIHALTQVYVLRIPSKQFFTIMGNFYNVKKAFELAAANADDFIESVYFDPKHSIKVETKSMSIGKNPKESKFVPADLNVEVPIGKSVKDKKNRGFLKADSRTSKFFNLLFFIDAYLTFIVIPLFAGVALMSWSTFLIIYSLDIFWVVKIIMTSRTAIIQVKTGTHLYSTKYINLRYLLRLDGMVLHILSVLPVELVVVAYYGKSATSEHCWVMCCCYLNRLLRVPYTHFYIQSKMKELFANVYLRLLNISVFGLAFLNLFVCLNLLFRGEGGYSSKECHWGLKASQLHEISESYLFVLNEYVSGGLLIDEPDTPFKIFFRLVIEVWGILSRAVVVNEVLIIIHVTQYTKTYQMYKLQELEEFLKIRRVSPALVERMQTYCTNLLNICKEGAHPRLLKETPPFLRLKIMEHLYIDNLKGCYIFQEIDEIFLKQLAMRLERFIFFPGDYIVEEGDIDQNMYFIYKGEVKTIEMDSTYPVLERTVDLFVTGESFGIQQGIFLYCPHSNTYRARILTEMLVLNFHRWEDLRLAFPKTTQRIYKRFKQTGVPKVR